MKLHKKLYTVKNLIGSVQRDANNPFSNSKYASLPNIQNHVLPLLSDQEIMMDIEFKVNPELPEYYRAVLEFTDMSDEGYGDKEKKEYDVPFDSTQKNPVQGFGSTTTYGQRYILAVYFNIPIMDADPDSNQTSGANCESKSPDKWLNPNTDDWTNTVAKLKSKTVTMSEVYKHYKISKANKEKLLEESK